jgi:hypothetical protein
MEHCITTKAFSQQANFMIHPLPKFNFPVLKFKTHLAQEAHLACTMIDEIYSMSKLKEPPDTEIQEQLFNLIDTYKP